MSMKFTISTAAVLAVLAGPALAGDHDLATELRDSGRYVPQANLPELGMPRAALPSGAYASAVNPSHIQASRPMFAAPAYDFQLQGR
jgi:hypothetical protein